MALTDTAHRLIVEHFADHKLTDKIAVDATCGNGHDTAFLAQFGFKTVFAFDVQAMALDSTQQLLTKQNLNNARLIHDGHENLHNHVSSEVECVMFNLGYMPSSDKAITTTAESTVNAINSSLAIISKTGIISVICYPGHQQGNDETRAVQEYLKQLRNWKVATVLAEYPSPLAPILFLITAS